MFRDRPLTWLYIAATVCVDLVLMVAESDQGLVSSVKAGLVLGQLAALAIWSVRGPQHRLARISCLVVVTGLLTYLIDAIPDPKPICLAFHTGYVIWIAFVTLVGDAIRYRLRKRGEDESSVYRWRVPLIEFFGWTTVVAIISFGARYMDFHYFHWKNLELFVVLLMVPTCMTLFIRRDLVAPRSIKSILLALIFLAAIYFAKNVGEYTVISQGAYLVLWMPVLSMEAARSRKESEQEFTPQQTPRTAKPQLFDPQD